MSKNSSGVLLRRKPMRYSLRDFLPLIIIFTLIIIIALTRQIFIGNWHLEHFMNDFMAGFFLVFGIFKIINWSQFVEAYQMYDLLAQRSIMYAYAYPVIEITLGFAYFFRLFPIATNLITFLIMLISSIGVVLELLKGRQIICACLGAVFKIPMTYVTLMEDILMAAMAFGMLLYNLF
jgi:hypothetical protein